MFLINDIILKVEREKVIKKKSINKSVNVVL